MKLSRFVLLSCLLMLALGAHAESEKILEHVVLFKFKAGTSAQDLEKVAKGLAELRDLPEVVSLDWGMNISKDDDTKGYTHAAVMTFKSKEDLDTFFKSPAHGKFVAVAKPLWDDVLAIDFWRH
jgi:hypothetical protein